MLVCGCCSRKGKENTVILVKNVWRYKITSSKEDQLIFTLEEKLFVPRDWAEETSLVSYSCARCGNDFFIPFEWIKKGSISMSDYRIYNIKRMPVCTRCKNEDKFLFYGHIPYQLQFHGTHWSISKIVNEQDESESDKEAVKIVYRSLVECDDTIPVQCRECYSHDVDLVPVKGDFSMSQHQFDENYVGA